MQRGTNHQLKSLAIDTMSNIGAPNLLAMCHVAISNSLTRHFTIRPNYALDA